jgi:ATP-dependent Zn protease
MGVGYSEKVAADIDAETQAILSEAEGRCREALLANRTTLDQLAHALMEQESLEGDALDDLLLNVKGLPTRESAGPATPAGAGAGAGIGG